jgi:ribonuclease Z
MSQTPTRLKVFGPKGVKALVEATLAMLAFDVKYRLDHHADLNTGPDVETTELSPGDAFVVGDCAITAHRTDHSPVFPTLGYRIEHAGGVAALAGDTVPCPELDAMCKDADVYVQTVIRDDLVSRVPLQRMRDILDYHSTVAQAGQTAARAGVKTLMLTHYVPALIPGQEEAWREIARPHFAGEIVLGDDLTTVTIAARA